MLTALPLFVAELTALPLRRPEAAPDANALMSKIMGKEMERLMGPEVFHHHDVLATEYSRAVAACRRGDLPAALSQLESTDARVPAVPVAALPLVTLYRYSAWANYYYKVGQGEEAVALLRQGLPISASLERDGCPVLIFRRLDQLLNIATIYLRQERLDEASELLRNILCFVLTGQARGLLIEDWDGAAVRRVRLFQEGVLDEVVSRLATQNMVHMVHPTHGEAYYYDFFFRDLLRDWPTDTYNRVVIYNWLYAKVSYFEQAPAEFLANVLSFVGDAAITPAYDVLRANLLAQVIVHFQGQPEATPLVRIIRAFAEDRFIDRQGRPLSLPLAA